MLNLLYALILLLIGLLIAKGLQLVLVSILSAISLDKISKQIKLTDILANGGIKGGVTKLLGDLLYWLVVLAVVTGVANQLGLGIAGALLAWIVAYLPSVLSAAYVLGVGILAAVVISGIITLIAGNIGLASTGSLAKIAQYAVVLSAFIAALGQLGVSLNFMSGSINLIGGAVALAAAIAFGLGAKDQAGDLIKKLF
jgi:hypothetical protein